MSPFHPRPAIAAYSSGAAPASSAIVLRTYAGVHSLVRNSRALSCSWRCSSLSPKSMVKVTSPANLTRLGHLEPALGDDIFLDVRGAAADYQAQREHPLIRPERAVHRVFLATRQCRVIAHRLHCGRRDVVVELGAGQLVYHRLDSRIAPAHLVGELAQHVVLHRLNPDLEIGQALPEN